MMRSLFSGVAGLKTHQTKMDVIGNNIANVNTTAYKSSSITFSDLMSQTTQNASGANAQTGVGGTNARQIGLGVKSGAINMNITGQGSAQSTGNPFDIMITGDNFFVVSNGSSNFFTRDGAFYVDGVGNLAMTSTGYNVMGWKVDETTGEIKQDNVTALRIMNEANMTSSAEATSQATVSGILDKYDVDVNSTSGKTLNLNFYDNLGYSYTARMIMKSTDVEGTFSVEFEKLLDSDGNEVPIDGAAFGSTTTTEKKTSPLLNTDAYTFTGTELHNKSDGSLAINLSDLSDLSDLTATATVNGDTAATKQDALNLLAQAFGYEGNVDGFLKLNIVTDGSTDPVTTDSAENLITSGTLFNYIDAATNTLSSTGSTIQGGLLKLDPTNGEFVGINGSNFMTLDLTGLDNGMRFSPISIDFSTVMMSNNNGVSTVTATRGDADNLGSGRALGEMIGVSIQKDGKIYASYDNSTTKLLGQIATANFANASGLEKAGDNLYSSTLNSGTFDGVGVDITANGGYMSTGVLEMSNVDLSQEFTDMITTQRGFQANSRIITVSDTLLEELTNLKR
ncbi:MAG: flagellar hook-basal body complex protein [Lachnospiraceae bacterium]|nr:flagellar hook-basal body complex protein [Lachnospiraceae bacterium]